MALGTVTIVESGVIGDLKYVVADVQPTSGANYTTGGEALSISQLGFAVDTYFIGITPGSGASGGRVFIWDSTNKKLMALRENDAGAYSQGANLTEMASNSNLSTLTVRIFAIGR